jgi:hypothetical protein
MSIKRQLEQRLAAKGELHAKRQNEMVNLIRSRTGYVSEDDNDNSESESESVLVTQEPIPPHLNKTRPTDVSKAKYIEKLKQSAPIPTPTLPPPKKQPKFPVATIDIIDISKQSTTPIQTEIITTNGDDEDTEPEEDILPLATQSAPTLPPYPVDIINTNKQSTTPIQTEIILTNGDDEDTEPEDDILTLTTEPEEDSIEQQWIHYAYDLIANTNEHTLTLKIGSSDSSNDLYRHCLERLNLLIPVSSRSPELVSIMKYLESCNAFLFAQHLLDNGDKMWISAIDQIIQTKIEYITQERVTYLIDIIARRWLLSHISSTYINNVFGDNEITASAYLAQYSTEQMNIYPSQLTAVDSQIQFVILSFFRNC